MRKTPIQLAAFVIILFLSQFAHADQFKSTGTVDVYFSPNGGATNAIVTELNNAKTEILVQAYSFTSAPITKALTDARRDIVVYIEMFYNSNKRHSYLDYLSPKEFEELWLLEKAA
jgi:phosphatidylserine/phosphatidylglycerophosphate/cardiolipin synthase-like enzyme